MKVLLLNQCFYPDVVSTAQHLTDLAIKLAEQGHDVTVIASQRGYDDPDRRFPRRETWKGIKIIRIPSAGLGKKTKWRRAIDFATFMINCALRMITLPKFDAVVALTSPPLISFLAALWTRLRGGRYFFWVMDLNPDEAIAAGWLKDDSTAARLLSAILKYSLKRAEKVFVLDRFMKRRIVEKGIKEDRLVVIPPWSHDDAVRFDRDGRDDFRKAHGLADKFVVMYSGNHSPCHPLDTLFLAARRLAQRSDIAFCFIGGGSEFARVKAFAKEHRLENIVALPYQPLDKLAASLSAADMHVVVMGDPFVGIIHPCKVYNILLTGTPFLYVGPEESHVVDIMSEMRDAVVTRAARQGEDELVVRHILDAATQRPAGANFGSRAGNGSPFSKNLLLPRMIKILEQPSNEARIEPATSETDAPVM